jgi:protein involved in polysaccharide export with SLBB domain
VENGQRVLVNHSVVDLQKALNGDKNADPLLKAGDVVSIEQLAGWQDIGSSVTITGEIEHPGNYGIEAGERLSSVLRRAGGFRSDAYPAAAVLERVQVRELGEQARQEMILRIETTPADFQQSATNTQDQTGLAAALQLQRQQVLANLRDHPASGRMVINISEDISKWENTSADIELRAGDTLVIPKHPSFVLISGQVYNAVSISYVPGKNVGWYLAKSGGPTPSGDKKRIFVLRADGSVVAHGSSWTNSSVMDIRMRPGDTIFVPEKPIGGSQVWRNIIATAQVFTAAALPLAAAGAL